MSLRLPHQLILVDDCYTCTACGGRWKTQPRGGCLSRQRPSALEQRKRPAPLCRQCVQRPARHDGLCLRCHDDADRQRRTEIAAMVARDQAAAQAWAQQEIAQGPLFVEAIGFFSDDTSALVEVAVIDSNGDTCLNTLVRTALPLPRWAQLRYRLSLSQIRVAPRMDAIAPDLAEKIMWEHIVSWNSHTPSALIASCLHDTGNAVPVAHWDDLRPAYARYVGDWMPRAKRYRLIGLPGRGPLALQCARASLNALREMAGMPALQFAAAQRWRPIPLLEERDPDADPDLWIE